MRDPADDGALVPDEPAAPGERTPRDRYLAEMFDVADPDAPQEHGDFDEVRFRFWEEEWWRRRKEGTFLGSSDSTGD